MSNERQTETADQCGPTSHCPSGRACHGDGCNAYGCLDDRSGKNSNAPPSPEYTRVLRQLSRSRVRGPMTTADIAEAASVPHGTAYRILRAMEREGIARNSDKNGFVSQWIVTNA